EDPSWVHDLRRAGIERFKTLGFPSLREEDWRFTRTRPIAEVDFRPAAQTATKIAEALLVKRTFDDSHCYRQVFVNGYAAPSLSAPCGVAGRGVEWGVVARCGGGRFSPPPLLRQPDSSRRRVFRAADHLFWGGGRVFWGGRLGRGGKPRAGGVFPRPRRP